jgi:hypothetical protein
MSFRIKNEAKDWFKHIKDNMEFAFDYYYLCLMVGLASKQKKDQDIPESDTAELTQDFPGDYRLRGRLIIALFIKTDLELMGINLAEKVALNEYFHKLVDPHSSSGLSNEGERLINRYANRGFEILTEWFDDKPRNLEIFLPMYKRKLDSVIKNNSLPSQCG